MPQKLGRAPAARSTFPGCDPKYPIQPATNTVRVMRPSLPILVLVGLLPFAGCAHRVGTPAAQATARTAVSSPRQIEHTTRTRLVQIYVDAAADSAKAPRATDQAHATAVAVSLREQMRQRGYDVRGSESTLPGGENGKAPGELARAVAAGRTPPAFTRAVTYLHPNAPRLVLFVHLQETPVARDSIGPGRQPIVLGAFIADSADGSILWSNRVSSPPPATDSQLRQLAAQLLKTLPSLPPA